MTVECADCVAVDAEKAERAAAGLCPECGRGNLHVHQGSGYRHDPADPRCTECGRSAPHVHKSGHRHRTAPPTKKEASVAAAKGDKK